MTCTCSATKWFLKHLLEDQMGFFCPLLSENFEVRSLVFAVGKHEVSCGVIVQVREA